MDKAGKVCVQCGKHRPAAMFYYRRATCKLCVCAKAKAYRDANYSRVRAMELERERLPKYRAAKARRQRALRQGSAA